MNTCKKLVLKCRDGFRIEPGKQVSVKQQIGDCLVSLCIPNPCIVEPSTSIKINRYIVHEVESDDENVYIKEIDGDKVREMYIYPLDVWNTIMKFYVEPLSSGNPVNEHLLLIGPPGTGKSMMIKLIANFLGLNIDYIKAQEIRSRYYGETEKNLEKKLSDALMNEPTIIGIDDAEFLITSRNLTGSFASGVEATEISIRDILFEYLEKIVEHKKRVLVVATTNFSPSAIDEALIRGGRFGEPVFISLPNYSALYRYALFATGDEPVARDLAYRAVSRGLTISDLKTMIKKLKSGLDPEFQRMGGRGYRRLHSEIVKELVENSMLRNEIESLYDLGKDRATTIYMDAPVAVGVALITQILMNLKRAGIMLTDPRHIDEFCFTLDSTKSIGVIPTTLPEDVQVYIRNNTREPLIYVGKHPPQLESYAHFLSIEELIRIAGDNVIPVVKSILVYYRIPHTTSDLKTIERIHRSKPIKIVDLLETIVSCGKVSEEILGRIVMKR